MMVDPNLRVQLLAVLRGHAEGVTEVRFSPDGSVLASADEHTSRLWDVGARTARRVLDVSASNLTFSPHGDLFAFTGEDGLVQLRSRDGDLIVELPRHKPVACGVTFSPDGIWVATGDRHGDVRFWEVATQQLVLTFHATRGPDVTPPIHSDPGAFFLTFTPDGSRLAVYSQDQVGHLQLWEVQREGPRAVWHSAALDPESGACAIRCSPDGQLLAVADYEKELVDLFDAHSLQRMGQVDMDDDVAKAVAFSPDSRWLAVAGAAGTVYTWDLHTQQVATQFAAHTDGYDWRANVDHWALGAMDWSPAGNVIVTSGLSHATHYDPRSRTFTGPDDYTVKLWEVHIDDEPWR